MGIFEQRSDVWTRAYAKLSKPLKNSLEALAVCESGYRNLTHGYFGWTHWRYIGGLGIPKWMEKRRSSTAQGASYEQQAVITAAVAARHGWGGWPSCSRRLGL